MLRVISCFTTWKALKNVMSYHTFQQLHQSYLHSHPRHHKPKNVVCRGNCCTEIHQLYIYFPLGGWKEDRKKTQEERKTKERTSILDKTGTTTYHTVSAENDTCSISKWTNPDWKGWRGREKYSFKNLFLDHTFLSLPFHDC